MIRYGCRVPTERNVPGGASQPVRRYPAGATPRRVTSSVLLQSAPNAADRNMQNIQRLSSGEYGKFYKTSQAPPPSAPESCRSTRRSQDTTPIASYRSQPQTSARDYGPCVSARSSARVSAREDQSSPSPAGDNPAPYAMMTQRTKMKAMLSDLDSSFSRRNKYDLSTAIAGPPNNIGHLKLYGVSNYKNFEEGGRWANSLRRQDNKMTGRK